jgi:hypothetical protein
MKSYDQVYHETLWNAVYAAVQEYDGIIKLDDPNWETWGFEAMSYETSQSKTIPGMKMIGRGKGKGCGLVVNLYRMPSGRYEVSAYVNA